MYQLPFGRGQKWMKDANAFVEALAGGWTVSGINASRGPVKPVTLHLHARGARSQVSGINQDFRGANNYRPNVIGDVYGDKNSVTSYLNKTNVVIPTDPSQPFGNAARNTVRAPYFFQMDFVASKDFTLHGRDEAAVPPRGIQPVQPRELPRAEHQPQLVGVRDDHVDVRRPAAAARHQAPVLVVTGLGNLFAGRRFRLTKS